MSEIPMQLTPQSNPPTQAPSPASADYDPLDEAVATERARRRYELVDEGFNEVPKRYRKFYRRWGGPQDVLAPNEALCPTCKVVIRSRHELRAGDRVFCMTCMIRFDLVDDGHGGLEMVAQY